MKKILKCKKCGKEIKAGEKFISEIIMPKSIVMPIGRLDTILAEKSLCIICDKCNLYNTQ